ncbi:MAG: NAD-dependent epimerase/dehydratase family protein [Planctomycetota bacterium]|jgi:nucleoside-diphosphate-sugar epimerase
MVDHRSHFGDAYEGRRVCVTGGAGFIGSHLVDALEACGAEVSVIDDLSTGHRDNLDQAAARLVEGSILDVGALAEAFEGATTVFHQAAMPSVPRSVAEPERSLDVNARGTLLVLEAARTAGVTRIVSASSSSVYGEQEAAVRVETMPLDPLSPYAAAKGTGEYLLRAYAHCHGLEGVSLRYFNIFGPRQRADSAYAAVIPRFADAFRRGERPVIYGDGTQTRDFTFVQNAVRANLLAGITGRRLAGGAVNIAAGEQRTVLELLEAVAATLGVEPVHDLVPIRPGEVQHSRADIGLARRMLGYEVVCGFDEGLRATVGKA